MDNDIRFMNEVFRIINGALKLDIDKVRNYTSFLADKLETAGERSSATRLRKLLEESDHQLHPTDSAFSRSLPIDSESRFPLIEKVNLKAIHESPIILSDAQRPGINEFISVAKSHSQLEAEGVATSISLLMYGPPGCGKSRLARFIAAELGLDLYVARLDGVISSFLGSTSKNIRALFDFASRTPCVLFLDEFDAIAKLRGDNQELGELKRVVNSFIQNLDTIGSQCIVLAATNHETLLDSAVWRRFHYRIELNYPSLEMRFQLWNEFAQSFQFPAKHIHLLADLSEGFSGSDIHEVCLRLRRQNIMSHEPPRLHDAYQALCNLGLGEGENRRFLTMLKGEDSVSIAAALRRRNKKRYSNAAIAQLFGVSKATAQRWALKGDTANV